MQIREATPQDHIPISTLVDTTFEGPAQARLVSRLRKEGAIESELIAVEGDRVIGYIAFARMVEPTGWLSLSPICVSPSMQGHGIGHELILAGLDHVRRNGATAVVVMGAPDYLRRFGFSSRAAENLRTDYKREHTLVYPIAEGSAETSGALIYPEAFTAF